MALLWLPLSAAVAWEATFWWLARPVVGAIPDEFPVLVDEGVVWYATCADRPCALVDGGGALLHAVDDANEDLLNESWYRVVDGQVRPERHRLAYRPMIGVAFLVSWFALGLGGELALGALALAARLRRGAD